MRGLRSGSGSGSGRAPGLEQAWPGLPPERRPLIPAAGPPVLGAHATGPGLANPGAVLQGLEDGRGHLQVPWALEETFSLPHISLGERQLSLEKVEGVYLEP